MRQQCGRYLNIARLINTVYIIFPTAILFMFADEILITFFKQNAFVSEVAIQYCIVCMPGVWAMSQFDATKRFLSAQQVGFMPCFTQIITSGIQIVSCYIFIIEFQWGIIGAAFATNITYIFNMIILDFWIAFHSEGQFKNMWIGWARSSLEGLGTFLEYGIFSAMMECIHWWALEVLIIMSSYRQSQNYFAAQVVIMNMFTLAYMVPQGISYTCSSLVGNYLGENKSKMAKRYAILCYIYCQFIITIACILFGIHSHKIISYFVRQEEVIQSIQNCMFPIICFMVMETSYAILIGIMKGLG